MTNKNSLNGHLLRVMEEKHLIMFKTSSLNVISLNILEIHGRLKLAETTILLDIFLVSWKMLKLNTTLVSIQLLRPLLNRSLITLLKDQNN